MSQQKTGALSKDFPLYHNNLIPIYINNENYRMIKSKSYKNKFTITNEHPDFFKLDGMKEEGYTNPYLNEVIKIDRNEFFKNIDSIKEQLKLINYIKSNRKFSQDPKMLKYIATAKSKEISTKREQRLKDKLKFKIKNSSEDKVFKPNLLRDKLLGNLKKYIPPLDYKMSGTVDYSKPVKTENNININHIKKYNFFTNDINKTAYLKNFSDYKICEAQIRDLNKGIEFQRKPRVMHNLLNGKYETIVPPPFRSENWDNFHENFYTIMNTKNKFRCKGGLFTEFSDKNKNIILLNQEELKLKMKIKREQKLKEQMNNSNKHKINLDNINNY